MSAPARGSNDEDRVPAAAAEELIEAADTYERDAAGLGTEFVAEIQRVTKVLVELPSLGEKLDEFIAGFHCSAFHTRSYSVAMQTPSISSPLLTVAGVRDTGRPGFMTAKGLGKSVRCITEDERRQS